MSGPSNTQATSGTQDSSLVKAQTTQALPNANQDQRQSISQIKEEIFESKRSNKFADKDMETRYQQQNRKKFSRLHYSPKIVERMYREQWYEIQGIFKLQREEAEQQVLLAEAKAEEERKNKEKAEKEKDQLKQEHEALEATINFLDESRGILRKETTKKNQIQNIPSRPQMKPQKGSGATQAQGDNPAKRQVPKPEQLIAMPTTPGIIAPNAILAKAMGGQTTDWDRVKKMSTRIQDPTYGLKEYFEDCVAAFPELKLFFLSGETSSGRSGEVEYQRTIAALFAVYWLLRMEKGGKQGFSFGVNSDTWDSIDDKSKAQLSPEKRQNFLDVMDWASLSNLMEEAGCFDKDVVGTDGMSKGDQRVMALLCLTAFHDIMKVDTILPVVQPEHAPYADFKAGDVIRDHDCALAYVMTYYPEMLPSFIGLPEPAQQAVLFTQSKLQFNHGWFVQAEAPPGAMLATFKQIAQKNASATDIALYFVHWVTDISGAEATPLGGAEKLVLKFPPHVLNSFVWSIKYLKKLSKRNETTVNEEYLEARWTQALERANPKLTTWGAQLSKTLDPMQKIAMHRLHLMSQASDPKKVHEAWYMLKQDHQKNLTQELTKTGLHGQLYKRCNSMGGPAILVYYGPGLLQLHKNEASTLAKAYEVLNEVYKAARKIWPLTEDKQNETVMVEISKLKKFVDETAQSVKDFDVWIVKKHNDSEAGVDCLDLLGFNKLLMEGKSPIQLLDFKWLADSQAGDDVSDRSKTAAF